MTAEPNRNPEAHPPLPDPQGENSETESPLDPTRPPIAGDHTDLLDGSAAPHPVNSRRRFIGLVGAGAATAAVAAPSVVDALQQDPGPQPGGGAPRPPRDGRRRPDRPPRRGGGRNGPPPPDQPDQPDGDPANATNATGPAPDPDLAPARFGRLFDLPPFAEPSPALREALRELGRPGGMMDANDPLEVGPIRLILEPELSPGNRDNPTNTAGVTFMGQFLDHDITRDAGSQLGRPTPVRRSMNLRSARFDLDSVYGGGPQASPELYDGFRFRIGHGGQFEDLPRDDENVAIIADDRNDENLMVSGLQCAFLMFHNAVLDDLVGARTPTAADFRAARTTVRHHYQWIIANEILPQIVGQAMVDDIVINGRQIYRPAVTRIPLEFQTAAYRFGHSQVRPSYRANMAGDDGEPFFAFVFDPDTFGDDDPDDLSGRTAGARRFVGWQTFFDFDDGEVRNNKRIDTKMSTPLFRLPAFTIPSERGDDIGPRSLATRNLLRHITWEIPSGQRIADEIGAERLAPGDLSDVGDLGANLDRSTPLFFYILREADVVEDGLHLGPVGGRIVGEVFMGLLENDPASYLNAPGVGGDWRPTLPQRDGTTGDDFTIADMLTIAGVDPTSRGQ